MSDYRDVAGSREGEMERAGERGISGLELRRELGLQDGT